MTKVQQKAEVSKIAASRIPLSVPSIVNYDNHPSVRSRCKRLVDLTGALLGLTVLIALYLPIAVAVKLDSRGSVLYSQTRCGLKGKRFRIWKFRSMVRNAEELKGQVTNEVKGNIFKNKQDPRVTKVGRFLRKTSLDELPQFWNVLKGDMSLVGTRPPKPEEVELYDEHQYRRLQVKPGITGEWQVNGRSCVDSFDCVVDMDLSYQRKWSVLYDLKIIFKTAGVVLCQKGAY